MAAPTDSFTTYDSIGNREDLSQAIYDISPTATPFLSGVVHTTATATNHEWQTDALDTPTSSNAVVEGEDALTDASAPTTRLGNQSQILDKVPRVTGTQNAVDSAGRANEMAYQVMKRGKELKNDLESSMLANKSKVVGNNSTARVMAGIESWIATNTDFGATGADPTGDGTDARTDGTLRAFDEDQLKVVLAGCWDEGGEPDTILVGSFNKQAASAFSGNAQVTREAGGVAEVKTLHNAIDVYSGDFGDLAIIPSRHSRPESALVLQMDMWALATLRDFQTSDLAKTGDTERKQLLIEATLVARNEAASGIVADLLIS